MWDVVKTQTEVSGLAHLKAADQLFTELNKILDLAETFREQRRELARTWPLMVNSPSGSVHMVSRIRLCTVIMKAIIKLVSMDLRTP